MDKKPDPTEQMIVDTAPPIEASIEVKFSETLANLEEF